MTKRDSLYYADRAQLPRNMIENSMFEEEPDVVDLAKEPTLNPLESEETEYEPRSSRLLVRGLGENELDEDEEDYESSAKLLGMSFMNRSSGLRNSAANYRQVQDGLCPVPSARTVIVCVVVVIIAVSVVTVVYLLPKCTFTKDGCHEKKHPLELVYPIATNGKVFPWAKSRLPNSIKPVHYVLTLHPDMTTMYFAGTVQIKLNITASSNNIVLHSSGLRIIKAHVSVTEGTTMDAEVLEYPTFEEIAIILPESLPKGKECLLTIQYTSNFSSTYYGFYKIDYMEKGNKRSLAATQFEPLAARKVFPCFDEPAFKSTFQINIIRNQSMISLSNMPKAKTSTMSDGLLLDEYSTSVNMSTYLVAFIVGDIKNTTQETNDTLVSVYAVPEKMDQVKYALDSAMKLLYFYSNYYNIAYPLKKLDLVAIPDFQAGAMENWGLITFRETALLYKEDSSSVADKQSITKVIAHELAHQWFGNLVTMEWWNDLWLNEGFATYMEYVSMSSLFPELNSENSFLKMRFTALQKDSLNASHPISTDIQSPEQIEEMFDDLSYIKGASILLMLQAFLSEDVFHHCIMEYLQAHQYGSTTSDSLWDSMNVVTNKNPNVKNMMKTWTQKAGYPLVTALRKGEEITVQQERFLRTPSPDHATNASTVWHIPLTYVTRKCSGIEPQCDNIYLLKEVTGRINVSSEFPWVKFNVNMTGYYIVDYGADGWDALIKQLLRDHTVLHSSDRANLIHDIFMLAGVGKVPLAKAFELLGYLANETNSAPITQALNQFYHIHGILLKRGLDELSDKVMERGLKLLSNLINQTWEDEGTLAERELRSSLLDFACSSGLQSCVDKAMELFNIWRLNNTRIPTDVMKVVFKVGAKTAEGWAFLWDKYTTSLYETEKRKILEALASTDNGRKLQWLMQESLDGGLIRSQELPAVLGFISKGSPGYLLAWEFAKQNWDLITQKFMPGSFPIQSIVSTTTYHFSTDTHLNEVIAFFNSTKGKSREMWCVKEAVETIKFNIEWMKNNLDSLKTWLQSSH
uniref:Leucyl-cystinyl aminopeptidase n=1 Tax=Xenopus tropicalis TaxID=8364 RepID=F7ETK7_XENTR